MFDELAVSILKGLIAVGSLAVVFLVPLIKTT